MADKSHPENPSDPPVGKVKGGVPPTADQPSQVAQDLLHTDHDTGPKGKGADYNPTTPDGDAPPNNLPGPHGPQGVDHLQQDPSEQ